MPNVLVTGWFPAKGKEAEILTTLHRPFLSDDYVLLTRMFKLETLAVTSAEKVQGSCFLPTYVKGFICTENNEYNLPYFTTKDRHDLLKRLLKDLHDKEPDKVPIVV